MTAARAFLVGALGRVLEGGDISDAELDAAVPDPFALDRAEKGAWEQLSHWADDEDIREWDENYAACQRERMRGYIADLFEGGS